MKATPYRPQLTKGFFVDFGQIARVLAYAVEHQSDGRVPPGGYATSIGISLSRVENLSNLAAAFGLIRPEPIHEGVDQLILTTDGSPLTYSGLAQAVKRFGKRTGVPRLHSHLFRHTFAVRCLMNGGDIMTLRLILGHATLEVTQMYMHLAEAHVKVQHHRFSPVGRLVMKVRGRR